MINYKNIAKRISGISNDSRKIEPGFAFVAIKGEVFDGHNFIDIALEKGASFIIYESDITQNGKNFFRVENSRKAFSLLASHFYNKQPENIIAITGTNGKTSIVSFFEQILTNLGLKSASIGTIGIKGFKAETSLTTPDPVTLYKLLRDASSNKIKYLALEASSHGLKQNRLDGVHLKAAGFSNFTQDHLDYHGSFENYFKAKMILFTEILQKGYAILNADIPEYEKIREICIKKGHSIISYGRKGEQIKLFDINNNLQSQIFTYQIDNTKYKTEVNLVGEFQIYNILCAIGFALSVGVKADEIVKTLPKLEYVNGRMEKLNIKNKDVYVDYAHSPDALEKALKSLRPYVKSRLIVLFGCGGNRDKEKRPVMGKIAKDNADLVIITDDNPRNEKPNLIRAEIFKACPGAIEINERQNGIEYALSEMQKGDVLLIAGKGHEDYQIIGDKKMPFSDKIIAENYANRAS